MRIFKIASPWGKTKEIHLWKAFKQKKLFNWGCKWKPIKCGIDLQYFLVI